MGKVYLVIGLLEGKGAGSPQDAFGGYDSVAHRFPHQRLALYRLNNKALKFGK